MPIPEDRIERHWITIGYSELWGKEGTYSRIEYQRLPELPTIHSPFDWLSELPQRDYGCTLDSDENEVAGFASIDARIQALGFCIPEDLRLLMTRPDIQAQIPSCTACYLDLRDTVTPLPGWPGSYAMRFMNDSQCCVLWYLLFQPNTPTRVLASHYFLERKIFDAMEYLASADEPLRYENVLDDSCICAESFGEFIFRFCIENTIWFATHDKLPLAPYELAYLQRAKKAVS
jgi:hypothetical protein